MTTRALLSFVLFSTLAACGGDAGAGANATGALAGHWAQETAGGEKGMTLEFDAKSDKLMVHTAPEADGHHNHLDGTYVYDAPTKAVTVTCALLGKDKGEVWQGTLDGEHLTVTSGGTRLTFHKGQDPHEHK